MRSVSDTIARLSALSRSGIPGPGASGASSSLAELTGFGGNPGALRAWSHVPIGMKPGAALIVALHGCTQSAADYDRGAGWSELADRQGFAVLLPEQTRGNNPNLCFNWFVAEDQRRDSGELLSIRQMIAAMVTRHGVDPARIFVTGLSAGGAMAASLLAGYPELFAGGGIIAGLPHGVADSMSSAFDRMRGHGLPSAAILAERTRTASRHVGAWPTISIWQGTADHTVHPDNAEALIAQWTALHGCGLAPSSVETVDGQRHRLWRDAGGRVVVEAYDVAGLGHGTPLATGAHGIGVAGPYMLEAGISSTLHLARAWGLLEGEFVGKVAETPRAAPPKSRPASGVAGVIDEALRAAGLLK